MNIIKTNFTYTNKLIPLALEEVRYIILHHTESQIASAEDIHSWHLANGWAGFGYNEYIRKDGTVYIGRGDNIGAHCSSMNAISYGICCEGNFDTEMMNPIQLRVLVERIKFHKPRFEKYKCTAPHRQFVDTACPGKNFPLAKILAESDFIPVPKVDEEFAGIIDVLASWNLVNSPDYWKNSKEYKTEYVQSLIKTLFKNGRFGV